jgi:hypothetical protein
VKGGVVRVIIDWELWFHATDTWGGVNYDDNDRYCLDGQRLIAISGQNGKSGSEYRTEIETFSEPTKAEVSIMGNDSESVVLKAWYDWVSNNNKN